MLSRGTVSFLICIELFPRSQKLHWRRMRVDDPDRQNNSLSDDDTT